MCVRQEGKQASLAADFSVTQFKHLGRLLMVHGRNSYKRSAALSQFVIHRSLCISTMQVEWSKVPSDDKMIGGVVVMLGGVHHESEQWACGVLLSCSAPHRPHRNRPQSGPTSAPAVKGKPVTHRGLF